MASVDKINNKFKLTNKVQKTVRSNKDPHDDDQ